MTFDRPNYSTKEGAELLASIVQEYWASQGHAVRTRILPIPSPKDPHHFVYVVSSDLRNGLPAGKRRTSQ